MSRPERTQLVSIVALGVFIRFAFLLWVEPLELWADEGQYVYQALAWNRFGLYLGSPEWVWPPGYPAYLALFLRAFGADGIFAAKLGQVFLSALIGGSITLLARRLFSFRAARIAGALWAVFLPLIGFTHYLWPETVFLAALLPAVYLFVTALDGGPGSARRLALTGALIGLSCLFKEASLPLVGLFGAVIVFGRGTGKIRERLASAAILALSTGAVLLPWTLRTYEVYGRIVPSGATLGENVFQGVNADYKNYDYAGAPAEVTAAKSRWVYDTFVRWPANAVKWERSDAANTIDRNSETVASAKQFARDYPGFYLRSRVKKLADWVTPLNFFQRHFRLDVYEGSIASRWVRRSLALASVALTCIVLIGGIGGAFASSLRGERRLAVLAVLLTFLAGIAIVGMSRYRVQVEPLLIVLAAGFWTERRAASSGAKERAPLTFAIVAWVILAALWALNAPEVLDMLRRTM